MTEDEQQERHQREKERKSIVNEVCMGMHRLVRIPYCYTCNEHNSSFTPTLSSMSEHKFLIYACKLCGVHKVESNTLSIHE